MLRQMTATTYIVERQKALLVWHRKFQKWQPPGGHVEEDELPHETALREAHEETGLEFILTNPPTILQAPIEQPHAASLPSPFLLMLQNVPAWGDQPAHQHFDFCYLAKRKDPEALLGSNAENNITRWFSQEELNQLQPGKDIFEDTLQIFSSLINASYEDSSLIFSKLN